MITHSLLLTEEEPNTLDHRCIGCIKGDRITLSTVQCGCRPRGDEAALVMEGGKCGSLSCLALQFYRREREPFLAPPPPYISLT